MPLNKGPERMTVHTTAEKQKENNVPASKATGPKEGMRLLAHSWTINSTTQPPVYQKLAATQVMA